MRPSQSVVLYNTYRSLCCSLANNTAIKLKYYSYKDLTVMVLLLEEDNIEKKRGHIWIDSSLLEGRTEEGYFTLYRKLMENKT
jgi:hypothetical protein